MQKELVFAKEYGLYKNGAHVYYLPEYKGIYVEWHGNPTTQEFKEILNLALEVVQKFSCKTWLANTLQLGPMSEEADRWVKEEYTPRMAKTSLQKFAVLLPEELMAHFSISKMTEAIKAEEEKGNLAFQTRYFSDIEAALAWFKET
jgi:hypothetical protein